MIENLDFPILDFNPIDSINSMGDNSFPKFEAEKFTTPNVGEVKPLFIPNTNLNINQTKVEKPNTTQSSFDDVFKSLSNQTKSDNLDSVGSVSFGELRRYPDFQYGKDNEQIEVDKLGVFGNWKNALAQNWYNAKSSFLSTIHSIPNVFNSIMNGDSIWDTEANKQTASDLEEMQYLYPIYKSKYAQEHPWNVLATGNLAENVASLGLIEGMGLGIVVQDLAIEAAGALTAIPTVGGSEVLAQGIVVANTTRGIGKIYQAINSISKAATTLGGLKNVLSGVDLVNSLKNVATLNNVKNAVTMAAKTALVANGEAGLEAVMAKNEFKKQLLSKYDNPSPDQLKSIEESANAVGNLVYVLNQALLSRTLPVTYGNLFKGKIVNETYKNLPVIIASDLAKGQVTALSNWSKGFGLKKLGLDIGRQIINEGLVEEGGQFAISSFAKDYYSDRFLNNTKESLFKSAIEGIKSLGTDEGLANIAGGSFIGTIPGLFSGITNFNRIKRQSEEYADLFNKTSNLFDEASINENSKDSISQFQVNNEQSKAIKNYAIFGLKQGNLEARLDRLNDFKQLDLDSFQKVTGYQVQSDTEKFRVVDSLVKEAKTYAEISQLVDKTFINPFIEDNTFVEGIKNLASRFSDKAFQSKVENYYKANLWEQSKDIILDGLAKEYNFTERQNKLKGELKEFGEDFINQFTDAPIKAINSSVRESFQQTHSQFLYNYLSNIEEQVKNNKETLKGLSEGMQKSLLEYDRYKALESYKQSLQSSLNKEDVEEFYNTVYDYLSKEAAENGRELQTTKEDFIRKTIDLRRLSLGKGILQKENGKLKTKAGQKQLIKEQFKNLQFYLTLDDLRSRNIPIKSNNVELNTTPIVSTEENVVPTPTTESIAESTLQEQEEANLIIEQGDEEKSEETSSIQPTLSTETPNYQVGDTFMLSGEETKIESVGEKIKVRNASNTFTINKETFKKKLKNGEIVINNQPTIESTKQTEVVKETQVEKTQSKEELKDYNPFEVPIEVPTPKPTFEEIKNRVNGILQSISKVGGVKRLAQALSELSQGKAIDNFKITDPEIYKILQEYPEYLNNLYEVFKSTTKETTFELDNIQATVDLPLEDIDRLKLKSGEELLIEEYLKKVGAVLC